jgi:hypothetical protein
MRAGRGLLWQERSKVPKTDALCSLDHSTLGPASTGLAGSLVEVAPADPASQAASRAAIVRSIDRGIPVLALHLMTWKDWSVVAGYGGWIQRAMQVHGARKP